MLLIVCIGRADSVVDPLERGQRQVEQDRIRLGMQMDDRQFQGALVDTQVRLFRLLVTLPRQY